MTPPQNSMLISSLGAPEIANHDSGTGRQQWKSSEMLIGQGPNPSTGDLTQ